MQYRSLLTVLVLILLLANAYIISEYNLDISRWARLITTGIFLLFLLVMNSYGMKMLSAFSLIFISDVLMLYYENRYASMATFIVRMVAYILLVLSVVPELKNLKTNLLQKIIFILVFGLNLFMLFMLVGMVPEKFKYPFQDFLFYGYGLAMISMVITSISYSNRYSSKASFFFTAATLCLVFSDITSFIAYYLEFNEFYFADRFFYILGLAGLVKFSSFSRSHEAVAELESL